MMVMLGGAVGTMRKMNEQNEDEKWTDLLGMNNEEEEEDFPSSRKWVIKKTEKRKCCCCDYQFTPVYCLRLFMAIPMWY